MWFASPLWLVALVPWGGLALWLLWGRYRRAQVPYLELWRGAIEERPKRPGVRKPPLPLLLAIGSMLLAVLASANPSIWGTGHSGTPLQVIVDRGLTMSASSHGSPRFRGAIKHLAGELTRRSPTIPVDLVAVPGDSTYSTEAGGLASVADELPPMGLHTSALLNRAVGRALRTGSDAIFLISDQPIQFSDPRIVRIAPESDTDDAGISLIAARETPTPQMMVRVLNQSEQDATTLDVITAGQQLRQAIQLPPKGTSRDYFVTPPELGETIEASVAPGGNLAASDLPADDRAWLARVARWPAIESGIPLDPAIERMVSVYTRRRPPAEGSATIQIVAAPEDLPAGQRGVVVTSSFADAGTNGASLEVTDHAITRSINWGELPLLPAITDSPAGWEPLVRSGGKAILAAQSEPVRKIWVGFATDQWSTETQFVIFWTNVFDWAGQEGRQFSASTLEERGDDWKPLSGPVGFPGTYQRDDGSQRAFNTLAEPVREQPSTRDWRERVLSVAEQKGGRSVVRYFAVAALICLLCSLATWRKCVAAPPAEHVLSTRVAGTDN
jgi:hypothetical protein